MQSAAEPRSDALYRDVRGAGPAVLLVHGTGGDADAWRGAGELLARRRRVIAYDRHGFSRSRGAPYGKRGYHRAHADDAVRLLDELGVARAAVCGWSAGGLVGLNLALLHPSRVSSVVLYEPPFQAARHLSVGPMLGYAKTMALRALGNKRAAAEAFFEVALGDDWDKLAAPARTRMLADADAVLHELDGGTGEDLSAERLGQLICPVTVMVGSQTSPFLKSAADRFSRLLPRATIIRVPGAAHAMPVLQPLAFADALDRALGPF
jgi:pimeloyl-ACP methyl ester carboxylesterase